jgi:tetratricopeptide (TPR) repeat protein
MNGKWNALVRTGMLLGLVIFLTSVCRAQGPQYGQTSSQNPTLPPADKVKTPSTPEGAAPPVNAEEDAAFKAFQDKLSTDSKKVQLGEEFVQKYPQSRYLPVVYSTLVQAYLQAGQVEKMEAVGEKEIALSPTDVQVMAILGQTIPRAINANTVEPAKQLDKAEKYSKRAIEVTPTIPKPDNLTDDAFTNAKNQTLAMAHGGLGLVYVRRGKFAEAIPELEQSVKIDPTPDPVNYYLLGVANRSSSHYDDAASAFEKCAAITGSMQSTCKQQAEQSKKLGATELSAPK